MVLEMPCNAMKISVFMESAGSASTIWEQALRFLITPLSKYLNGIGDVLNPKYRNRNA
jgi:hypothetical protein